MIILNKDKKPYPQPENIPVLRGTYVLSRSFVYTWRGRSGKLYRIIVPKGFRYDGASIPRIFWTPLGLSKDGLHRAAATVHDFIYGKSGDMKSSLFMARTTTGHWMSYPGKFTRKQADNIFYHTMLEAGVNRTRANIVYWAVRAFGGGAWK